MGVNRPTSSITTFRRWLLQIHGTILAVAALGSAVAGLSLGQVVRTRTLLVRIEDWQAVAAVHGGFFGEIRPANTIMHVTRFIDPDWLVEFEADAIVNDEQRLAKR